MANILLIGGGTMGEILLQKLSPDNLTVAEHSQERRDYLASTYKVNVTTLSSDVANQADTIILAIKPQDASTVAETITPGLHGQLIISIMAGVNTTKLQTLFKTNRVIRTMPNTPAKLGLGMTVWTATPTVTSTDKQFVQRLLQDLGKELYVDNDDWIDKATAVSGSGPAYVFLFAEQLVNAAEQLGFKHDEALQLVQQTLLGASTLLFTGEPKQLREQVTSKGGTTFAALTSLAQHDLQSIWNEAIQAAYNRAKEL